MKVGLVSLYACGNAGDEALLRSVIRRLRLSGVGDGFTAIGVGPSGAVVREIPQDWDPMGPAGPIAEVFAGFEGNRRANYGRLFGRGELVHAARAAGECDLLLWAGGYWLHDRRIGVPLTIDWLCRAAARHGFYAVGAGPLRSWLGSRVVSRLARGAAHLSVRDEGSREVLRAAGVDRSIMVTSDPAVELESCTDAEARRLVDEAGLDPDAPTVAVCPCAWYSMEHYYSREEEARRRVVEQLSVSARRISEGIGVQVLLVPTMWPEDAAVSEEIVALTACDGVGTLRRQPSGPEAQGVIGLCEAVVSMRLHPAIFALNTATPIVAVAYARKVEAFMSRIGLSDSTVSLDDFDVDQLLSILQCALQRKDELRERLREAHSELLAEAEATGEQLACDVGRGGDA